MPYCPSLTQINDRSDLPAMLHSRLAWCEALMSTVKAEKYARQARNSDTLEDVGEHMKCAIDELAKAIHNLDARVGRLESKALRNRPEFSSSR